MRELKFRAWDKQTRDMLEFFAPSMDFYNKRLNRYRYFFDRHIIRMQFTGLHDRNGREIYEGDIIEEYDDGLYHWVVKWDNECACFYLHEQNIGEKFYLDDLVSVVNKGKVIGNIFQDGDLLDSEISKVDRD